MNFIYWILDKIAFIFDSIFLHKLYESRGLSRKSVLMRSIWSWFVCTLILGSLLYSAGFKWNYSEEFMMAFIGCFAMFWGLFQNFHKEYISKYLRLARIHDENLPSIDGEEVNILSDNMADEHKFNLSTISLNFAEDCKKYHMQNEESFSATFDSITSSIEASLSADNIEDKYAFLEENLPELYKLFPRDRAHE